MHKFIFENIGFYSNLLREMLGYDWINIVWFKDNFVYGVSVSRVQSRERVDIVVWGRQRCRPYLGIRSSMVLAQRGHGDLFSHYNVWLFSSSERYSNCNLQPRNFSTTQVLHVKRFGNIFSPQYKRSNFNNRLYNIRIRFILMANL